MSRENMSRSDYEQRINEGWSVMLNHVPVYNVDALPSEAILVQGNPKLEAAARDRIDASIARLLAERSLLDKAAEARANETGSDQGRGDHGPQEEADEEDPDAAAVKAAAEAARQNPPPSPKRARAGEEEK